MTWKSSVEMGKILSELPELEDVKYAFSLGQIVKNAVFAESFTADSEWSRIIVPTESGKRLLRAVGPSPDSHLALLGYFFHLNMLVDYTASDLDAIRGRVSESLLNRQILLPHITGRELYDKFNDEFVTNRTDHLDPPQVDKLLDGAPTGVYQIGTLVTGPFGILNSSEIRWMPPSPRAPLWHCSDTGCSALHYVLLRSGHEGVKHAYANIAREALRSSGPPSEWQRPLLAKLLRPDDATKEVPFADILPLLASCVVGEDRSKLTLAALRGESRHLIRQEIEATPQSQRVKETSAEALSAALTPEEQLQVLALVPTREIVELVDRLIHEREILVQPEELRDASLPPQRFSRHDLSTEMSSQGLRSPGQRPLARLRTTIVKAYTEIAATDALRWRIHAPERIATGAALADHIQRVGPLATVRELIMPERLAFDKVSDLVFLQQLPGEEPEEVTTRLLWKLGFSLPRYTGRISLLRRRLEDFNQCLLGLGSAADSEEDREKIRRSGVNLFVSLEDFLERLVSYNLWLCASDHFVDTKFRYDRHDAVRKVPQVLGETVCSGDATFSWNSNGDNTIGTTQAYLWKLLDWLLGRQSADAGAVQRSEGDFPHYAFDPDQVFSFAHIEAWADFHRAEFEAYIRELSEIADQIAKSELARIRNGLDHTRSAERFPSVESMLAMVSRLRKAVEIADVQRLIPKLYWLEHRNLDRYGSGTLVLKDYAERSYSLSMPIVVISMPRISFYAPVIISPGTFLADGAVPLVLSIQGSGEYAKYWAGYPRRRQIPPP